MDDLKPPILLIGNYRSGTTMLHDLFDLHPEVKSWFEPRTIWQCAAPMRPHDRFDESDATPRIVRYVRKRFLRRQREQGGLRVMDKTPTNTLRIPYVHRIFPESRLIYIVRDPLANLASAEKMWKRAPLGTGRAWGRVKECPKTQVPLYAWTYISQQFNRKVLGKQVSGIWGVKYEGIRRDYKTISLEEIIAKQWVTCAKQADEDLKKIEAERPGEVLRLRYEDFVSDPVEQFERVLAHQGLEMT
ncbi:MAG: sulfotransferase, partial [Phycisphaerales bacterium]|nr:sulfotransferase [Phycisphaerales bacterium]